MSHFKTAVLKKEIHYKHGKTKKKESVLNLNTDHHWLPLSVELWSPEPCPPRHKCIRKCELSIECLSKKKNFFYRDIYHASYEYFRKRNYSSYQLHTKNFFKLNPENISNNIFIKNKWVEIENISIYHCLFNFFMNN